MGEVNYNKKNLPSVNEVGIDLEKKGLVKFGNRAYNQIGNNCFEIASEVSKLFGYDFPKSRKDLIGRIFDEKSRIIFDKKNHLKSDSPVKIIVRGSDNDSDYHVSIQAYGKEFNYGPSSNDGFVNDITLPIFRR